MSTVATDLVDISPALKRQLWFWVSMLRVCNDNVDIPRPGVVMPPWSLEVYTDAAGGTSREPGHGVGAVAFGWWVVLPWGRAINTGRLTGQGTRLDRMLSTLELLGPLLGLSAAGHLCRGLPVKFYVDNSGANFIWRKGYSTSCEFSTAMVAALATVAAGLGCKVDICKITRCSTPLADMSDALSKSAFGRFWTLANQHGGFGLQQEPLTVPKALLQWVLDPQPDFELGDKILRELACSGPVLGY